MDNNFNAEDNDNQKATYKDASNTYRGPEFKMPKFGIGQRIIAALVFTVALAVYIFFATPLLNIRFTSSLILMAIIICIYLAIINYKIILKLKYVIAFLFVIVIGANFISSPIFHSQKYYDLLGEVGMHDYSETMPNIDNTLIPVVDKALAKTLGDKVLGNDIGLGSQYTVGEYYFVSTKDDLAWVAPLEPLSFFKWLSNDGSPGYVYVSATNPNDVRLVQDINGEPLAINYTNLAYLFDEIYRHAYLEGNMTKPMTDLSFEIDDEGRPFWVISVYKPTILFSGFDSDGVIIVDAQSGESEYYKETKDVPAWVERVNAEWIIEDQIENWGAYKNGWLNTVLAQDEMIKATEGSSYVFIEGEPYYYTGLTSVKSDESTVGFMLVNLKTKKSDFYAINGATENAAQKSAEGQVQQFSYSASYPILLNLYEKPTYFMTLKDKDGLIKQYAYVSVENYNIVGVGGTQDAAKKDYYKKLNDNNAIDKDDLELVQSQVIIERISFKEGNYYIKFVDLEGLYYVSEDVASELVLTNVGDTVKIEYVKEKAEYIEIIKFENTTL